MTNLLSEEKSLPQKISEDIITLILEENLQPGDKLPNETILSERLNAGRSSVREAMKLLASRNIVTIRQGSGTYIASSPGMVDDPLGFTFIGNKQKLINDLLEVRFLLEPPIAAMAATRADKKDIKKITALCDEVEDLLKKHENHTQKDIDFHAAIALSSKNVVVPRLVPVINSSIPLFVETTRGTLLEETIETHREIADAIAAHDPLRAQDAMYLHLVYNRKRIQMIKKDSEQMLYFYCFYNNIDILLWKLNTASTFFVTEISGKISCPSGLILAERFLLYRNITE